MKEGEGRMGEEGGEGEEEGRREGRGGLPQVYIVEYYTYLNSVRKRLMLVTDSSCSTNSLICNKNT